MENSSATARERSARLREELAKRGQIETRVEHTEKLDLAEGDRERITELERVCNYLIVEVDSLNERVAELSNRLDTLTQDSSAKSTNATSNLIPQDDGSLMARVIALEEFAVAQEEFRQAFRDFATITMDIDAGRQRDSEKLHEMQGRIEEVAHRANQAVAELGGMLSEGLHSVKLIAEGK